MLDRNLDIRPAWLNDYAEFAEGQIAFKPVAGGTRYVAIIPFLFTSAIIVGRVDDPFGYENRWCYEDFPSALAAFEAWDGMTEEPAGWHRHPDTGRRRPGGDPTKEYVAP